VTQRVDRPIATARREAATWPPLTATDSPDDRFQFRVVTGPTDVPVEGAGVALGVHDQVDGGAERHGLAADVTLLWHCPLAV